MGISFHQALKIGTYVLRKKITGQQRYPLVLMLEPLFRCNLACVGCGNRGEGAGRSGRCKAVLRALTTGIDALSV